MNEEFRLETYDPDYDVRIQASYCISERGYYYRQYHYDNGISFKPRRISEAEFVSALEELMNV